MENVAPLVEISYSLTRQNQERSAGRELSAPSPACTWGPEAFLAQHPLCLPWGAPIGRTGRGRVVAHGGRPATRPSSLSKPGERVQVLVFLPGALGPSSQHLPRPPPPHLGIQPVWGGGDPCKGLCSAPRGHPGCERHPEAFHLDPVFPGVPFGADARNLLGGGCDALEPSAHLPARREAGPWPVAGWAARSVPAGAWPCAHRRGSRVRERAAQARGTSASPPPPASRSRGTKVGCFQPHLHGPGLRGQLKLNETHRRGARS